MNNLIISLIIACTLQVFTGCGNKDEPESKNNLQYIADKEKELNDREARIRLKEIELEEREKRLNLLDTSYQNFDTTLAQDSASYESDKKLIQQQISRKFENPSFTVRDYFEYIKRGIDEKGSFDSNMKKAQKYYPSRTVERLKNSYRRTKSFHVLEEPKIVSQKEGNATVVAKVKQVEVVKQDGKDQEVTRVLTVTYNLTADKQGQWVIKNNTVKFE